MSARNLRKASTFCVLAVAAGYFHSRHSSTCRGSLPNLAFRSRQGRAESTAMNAGFMDIFKGAVGTKGTWSAEEFQRMVKAIESSAQTTIDIVPNWDDLEVILRGQETAAERAKEDLYLAGRGGANHKASIRLFDAPDGYEPEVTLYRDTAGWCPYCEKVWIQLEEKRIPYKVVKVPMRCYGDKPRSFMQINPSGGIPVAVIKGKVISESNEIMQLLEEEFPTHNPLLPKKSSPQSPRVAPLLRLERQAFSHWFSWLTSRSGSGAAAEMDNILITIDTELAVAGGPYFLGGELSMVDIMFAPFLERMAASLPYYKGFKSRSDKYPNLLKWYEAMDQRESYIGIKSDYVRTPQHEHKYITCYTHCHDLPPQIGGCQFLPESAPFKAEIDGGAWHLSVDPSLCLEPMIPSSPDLARRDAVRQCLKNHAALVGFSLRAIGDKGSPVSAPLANPYAQGDEEYRLAVDLSLRTIMHAMLTGSADSDGAFTSSKKFVEILPKNEVKLCLLYLRERIGVPRDMTVHGARQFRAHINWFIKQLEKEKA